MNRKWRGTALFLAIFVVMGATFGLKLYLGSMHSPLATSLAAAPVSPTATAKPGGGSPSPVPSAAATTSGPGAAATTITGDTESTPYGNVQVSVRFSGRKITNVTVLQVPDSGNYDQQVAQVVPPTLLQEVLSSQSATVNTVSGGTYTSNGYLQSVQSAIDKLP
ncbi:FMN-binding protein [Arthrobacter sp. SDTb3-6]|uniref:FMN-binding protein n=1 Tax=Arthrobacter sp. SDTb3-6 TaxID=2713571 RepID=UPI001C400D90|nr:FMN-binding protein [Arthrobacter sp. SDTb3-6]